MKSKRALPLHLVPGLVLAAIVLGACAPAGAPAPYAPGSTGQTAAATEAPAAGAVAAADTTGSLTVLDWAGYDQADFWIDFKNNFPKVNVNFEIGESDADIYSKMKAGDQADIFHPYTGWLQFYVDEGLVQEIDTSKLTYWDKVPEKFKQIGQFNGKQYFVPWDWGFSSVLYRTDKVTEPVDSWSALMDPKYSGHVSMWDDGTGAVDVYMYLHGLGNDYNKITPDVLEKVKQEWIDQKKLNLFYWAGEPELTQGMSNGDVWVAYAWQGAFATLLSQGIPVAYADPKEGRNSWVGVYGIRKGTPNYDLALKFLDQKLAVATGNNVVNLFYYGHSNQDVMNGITDETLKKTFSIDDPGVLQKTNFTPNLTAEQRDAFTAMWAEVKAAP